MNLRTILHFGISRVILWLYGLMALLNPPMVMTRSCFYYGENERVAHNFLMWDNTFYYQIGKEWVSYTNSIEEGMKIFEEGSGQ